MIAVLVKELRTRMRGWRTPAILILYLLSLGIVCFLVMQTNLSGATVATGQAARIGITLFTWLSYVQMVMIVVITPATTASAISGERQRQTLDLLLVTKLSSFGITVGKLAAAIAFNLVMIVCSLPIFAMVFLFGGVGVEQVAEVFILFVATVLSFGSIGLLISALARRANSATVAASITALVLTLGLLLLTFFLQALGMTVGSGRTPLPITAYFDPGYALAAVLPALDPESALGFDISVWQVNILAAAMTTIGCVALCAALLRDQRA